MSISIRDFFMHLGEKAESLSTIRVVWRSELREPDEEDHAVLIVVGVLKHNSLEFFKDEPCYGKNHSFEHMSREEIVSKFKLGMRILGGPHIYVESLL